MKSIKVLTVITTVLLITGVAVASGPSLDPGLAKYEKVEGLRLSLIHI